MVSLGGNGVAGYLGMKSVLAMELGSGLFLAKRG